MDVLFESAARFGFEGNPRINSSTTLSNSNPVEGCGTFSVRSRAVGSVPLCSVAEALVASIVRSVPVRTTRLATTSVSALYGRSITPFSSKTEETGRWREWIL